VRGRHCFDPRAGWGGQGGTNIGWVGVGGTRSDCIKKRTRPGFVGNDWYPMRRGGEPSPKALKFSHREKLADQKKKGKNCIAARISVPGDGGFFGAPRGEVEVPPYRCRWHMGDWNKTRKMGGTSPRVSPEPPKWLKTWGKKWKLLYPTKGWKKPPSKK